MELPKETLDAIREELPQGGQKAIAEEAEYSPEYVSQVLTGSKPITDSNKVILSIAQRLIREKRDADQKLINGLNSL